MSLLPSSPPDVEAAQEGDVRLLGFDDEATASVLEAISSETARELLAELHESPRPPSALADRADVSLQNASYHLEKLQAAELVQVVGTQYSEKGREMDVYGPADEPLVVFVGTDERKLGLKQLLERFVGATGLLAVLSLLLHSLVEGGLPYVSFTGAGGGPGAADPTIPLATAVFLGGFVMLIVLFAWRFREPELERLLGRLWRAPLLGGRDRDRSRRAALAAVGASVALAVPWLAIVSLGHVLRGVGPFAPAPVFVAVLVGAAAVQAYANDGLLVSWLVVFAPVAVFVLGIVGAGLAGDGLGRLPGVVGYPVIIGAGGALVLGTTGFLLGAGARRVVATVARRRTHDRG